MSNVLGRSPSGPVSGAADGTAESPAGRGRSGHRGDHARKQGVRSGALSFLLAATC